MIVKLLNKEQKTEILSILNTRFEKNKNRHKDLSWNKVLAKIEANPNKLWSLHQMEITGGEPDVIAYNAQTNEYTFCDCSAESPKGRRSLCYDKQALDSRKEHKPKNDVISAATEMGIELLTEEQYFTLQLLGKFDTKTSSWLKTPSAIRNLGGAIFGDYRFGRVFIYHNGADSYYGSRGFRGYIKL